MLEIELKTGCELVSSIVSLTADGLSETPPVRRTEREGKSHKVDTQLSGTSDAVNRVQHYPHFNAAAKSTKTKTPQKEKCYHRDSNPSPPLPTLGEIFLPTDNSA